MNIKLSKHKPGICMFWPPKVA